MGRRGSDITLEENIVEEGLCSKEEELVISSR